ncbi:MAG: glycosyltransferase family 4 protein [Solirubrobacterales bacterium]|nr:glycosyltransferase family 4 protein [Solirubrobacterales bacterium]
MSGGARPPVLIDARAAARPELGGVERWARELAARLPALHPGRYAVARPPAALSHRTGHAWEQLVLPARRAQLLLCPANLAPVASRRTVVVIHDVAPLREPRWYSGLYVRWQRTVLPRIARHARSVIVPSAFSRDEVRELLGVDAHVVPGGVDPRFRPGLPPVLGLTRPYVLTVASRTARKNLAVLELTAHRLAARGYELVTAGGDRPQFRAQADARGVRALGHVDDASLPGLYANAAAFVLPSLYEGFGLTALEALACGTPTVVADRGALPEVCGDAALLVDPTDPEAVAAAVERALDFPAFAQAGPARAAPFTWDATAAGVDRVVAEAL